MTERSLAIEIHRLEVDGYSVPKGSLGFFDDGAVRWLPPATGMSSPIVSDHFIPAGELLIPVRLFSGTVAA